MDAMCRMLQYEGYESADKTGLVGLVSQQQLVPGEAQVC
jgi:hypothetical protein